MKSSRQSHDKFITNQSSRISQISSPFQSPLRESQYFGTFENHKHNIRSQAILPIYFDQNMSQKNYRNSQIYDQQRPQKQSSALERSKSQVISSLYVSPFKKDHPTEELNQSYCLASSNACQITFAKQSKFIPNIQKQSFSLIQPQKYPSQLTQNFQNDYGYHSGIISVNNRNQKEVNFNLKSSMKSSHFADSTHFMQSSAFMNKNQSDKKHNFIEPLMFQSQIIAMRPIKSTTVVFKNQPTDFTCIKAQLKRTLSNVSILQQKSRNSNNSGTKIHFNFISPSKSETKTPHKFTFKKQDVKNPLSKLSKKKQSSKAKLYKSPETKIKTQTVNEYFPEFKVKKNKILKGAVSPPEGCSVYTKSQTLKSRLQKQEDSLLKSQQVIKKNETYFKLSNKMYERIEKKVQNIFPSAIQSLNPIKKIQTHENEDEDCLKHHTFISSLEGFSQLSDIKLRQKQDSTEISNETPKNTQLFQFETKDTQKYTMNNQKEKKTGEFKVTLTEQIIQLSRPSNEIADQSISEISKSSQVSIPSNDLNLSKKEQNNSSTDYEEEIVRKLKQDLGLNYSYYKK